MVVVVVAFGFLQLAGTMFLSVSAEYGWLVDAFMAWSTAYAIPAAVGIPGRMRESTPARYEYFYSLPRTFSVLSYGYRPYVSQVWSVKKHTVPVNGRSATNGLLAWAPTLASW